MFYILVQKKTHTLTEEDLPYYGYGDYEKWSLIRHPHIVEAETKRKAQSQFKTIMMLEEGMRIRFAGKFSGFWVNEFKSRKEAEKEIKRHSKKKRK